MLQCFKMQCCNYAIKIGQLGQFSLNDVIKRKCEKIVTIIICEIIITMSSRLMIANFLIFNRLKIDSTISHGNNPSDFWHLFISFFLSLFLSKIENIRYFFEQDECSKIEVRKICSICSCTLSSYSQEVTADR